MRAHGLEISTLILTTQSKDNCWAFSSIIEDCLHTLYKSTFTIGNVKNRWISSKQRQEILAIAQAKQDTPPDAAEISMNKVLQQAREARAGIFQGVTGALLEWSKQQGNDFRGLVAPQQRVNFVSKHSFVILKAA